MRLQVIIRWILLSLFMPVAIMAAESSSPTVKYDNTNFMVDKWTEMGLLGRNEAVSYTVTSPMLFAREHNGHMRLFMRGDRIEFVNSSDAPITFALYSEKIVMILLIVSAISLLGVMVTGSHLAYAKDIDSLIFFFFSLFLAMHNTLTMASSYLGYLFYYLTTSFGIKLLNRKFIKVHLVVDALFILGVLYAYLTESFEVLKAIGDINYLNGILVLSLCVYNLKNRNRILLSMNMIICFFANLINSLMNYPLVIIGFSFYVPYIVIRSYQLISRSVLNEKTAIENEHRALENLELVKKSRDEIEEKNQLLDRKRKELALLNEKLEEKVIEKTKDINSLLNNINSGILSIGPGLKVSKDYSAHLPRILEKKEIAQKDFSSLFLDDIDASPEVKDQCLQALYSCMGEDPINFEMNSENFLVEAKYHGKILKCGWSISLDSAQHVEKVLLVLNDITREKEQERLLREKETHFTRIKELIDAKETKSNGFFATSKPLMERTLIALNKPYLVPTDIDDIYVSYHTVKGASRTLGFKSLSNSIHICEANISKIRDALKQNPSATVAIDAEPLKRDYQLILNEYNTYWNINKHDLNRSDNYEQIAIDKKFIKEHYSILSEAYNSLNNANFDKDFVAKNIFDQKSKIINFISVSMEKIFDDYRESFVEIAKELKKNKPMCKFKIQDYYLTEEHKKMLDNIFTHLIRNIMDHGIESNVDRLKAGKADYGTVFVNAEVDSETHMVRITVKDDGRGIAMKQLQEKGIQQGLLTRSSSAATVANAIFLSGMSTAENVSEISGRGVGMAAVRQFLREHEGDIHVVLGQCKDTEGAYFDFHFEITFPAPFSRAAALAG